MLFNNEQQFNPDQTKASQEYLSALGWIEQKRAYSKIVRLPAKHEPADGPDWLTLALTNARSVVVGKRYVMIKPAAVEGLCPVVAPKLLPSTYLRHTGGGELRFSLNLDSVFDVIYRVQIDALPLRRTTWEFPSVRKIEALTLDDQVLRVVMERVDNPEMLKGLQRVKYLQQLEEAAGQAQQ